MGLGLDCIKLVISNLPPKRAKTWCRMYYTSMCSGLAVFNYSYKWRNGR